MKERIRTDIRRHNRLCARLLVIAMSLFIGLSFWYERSMTVSADTGGSCGDNVNYYFSRSSGTLTIYGEGAMKDCSGNYQAPWSSLGNEIKTVKIESGITSIGNYAFESCFGLTSIEIPSSVESIGDQAFSSCRVLESVTIPGSVKSIGDQAFFYCVALESVTISEGVESIGDQAFSSCDVLESVEIPGSVKSIGDQAFAYCRVLESVTISEGVESIGDKAFYNCDVLESVTIPGSVESIGDSAFYLCSSLTSVTIPGSVKSIGDKAFAFCRALESVTISEGVESIGQYAFYYCDVLESVTIPGSVKSIGTSAFGNTNIGIIYIPSGAELGVSVFSGATSQIKYEVNADGTVSITEITPGSGQTTVAIPETISGHTVVSVASDYQQYVSSTGHTHYAAGKATCTEDAICAICGVTLDSARGHAYDYDNPTFKWAEDYSTCKLEFTCTHDNSHIDTYDCEVIDEETKAATCEEDGEREYTASVTFGSETYSDTQTEVIEKLGHEYGEQEFKWAEDYSTCTAEFTCMRDGHIETVDCTVSSKITIAATCEEDGEKKYTASVTFGSETYSDTQTEVIEKRGHEYGEPEFKWVENYSACTATFTCKHDNSHIETVDCTVSSKITKAATCEEDGEREYTASVTFGSETYSDTQTEVIEKLGHEYGEPEFKWAEDYSTCTAEFTCTHDNSHIKTVDCTVSSEITKAATCEEDGEKKYTASVTFGGETYSDTQTEVIEKLGHEYGEPEFKWAEDYSTCTAEFTYAHDNSHTETYDCAVSSEITKAATANTEGERTYTATAQVDGVTYTATKTEAVAKLPAAGSSSGEQNSANGGSTNSSSVNSGSSEWATTETLYTDADNRFMRRLVNGSLEIVGDSGVLAQGTKIKAMLLSSGDEFERAGQAVSSRLSWVSAYKVYDISMMTSAGLKIHELSGYVSVTLPVPEGLTVGDGKSVMVYRLEEDGTLTRCDTAIAEGNITFLTNHFSTYVFAEYSVASSAPETSDSNVGVMFAALFLFGCVAVAYVFSKKRKFF